MKELIATMGDSFRGLWRSYIYQDDLPPWIAEKWTITFIYRGQYIETPNMDTIEQAFQFALNLLKKEKP